MFIIIASAIIGMFVIAGVVGGLVIGYTEKTAQGAVGVVALILVMVACFNLVGWAGVHNKHIPLKDTMIVAVVLSNMLFISALLISSTAMFIWMHQKRGASKPGHVIKR